MKNQNLNRNEQRLIRSKRIKNKITSEHEPINFEIIINKTDKHLYAQLFDISKGQALFSVSTLSLKLPKKNKESAKKIGEEFAKKALEKNIVEVRFNRNGYPYHGLLEVLANACRENGLKF